MSGSTLFSIGEALIDMIPSRVGCSFDEVPSFSPRTGGAPANVCAAFARLGGKSAFLSQLGDDPFGHKIARELEACGIDLSHLAFTDKASTALAFVSLEEDGSRTFSFYRKPSADLLYSPEQIDPAWFADAFALHFCSVSLADSPMRYAHLAAIAAAREAGAIVSFDPNLREPLWPSLDAAAEQMLWGLKNADVVKISGEEAEFLFGGGCEKSAELILNDCSAKLVMITLGSEGCFIKNRTAQCRVPAARVKAADTTGAGDIFGGSAAYCLLSSGKAPEDLNEEELNAMGRFACAAAGLSVQRPGGISSVPGKEEILALLAAGD